MTYKWILPRKWWVEDNRISKERTKFSSFYTSGKCLVFRIIFIHIRYNLCIRCYKCTNWLCICNHKNKEWILKPKLLRNNLMEKPKLLTSSCCGLSQPSVFAWKTFCILASTSGPFPYTFLPRREVLRTGGFFRPFTSPNDPREYLEYIRALLLCKLNRMEHFQCQLRYTDHIQFKGRQESYH